MNLNKAFVLGNLTRDPEVRALPSGQQVTNFSIATNRYYTDSSGQKKEEAEFHNIVCFGKLADISSRYLTKGALCFIEGRIKTRNWQDQQGQKHYKTEIIAETLQLGPKGQGGGGESYSGPSKFQPRQASGFSPEPEQVKQEDIPVIEENYTPPAADLASNAAEPKAAQFADNAADEIDVRDIPF
jgi:single-strand DNA-binding protein